MRENTFKFLALIILLAFLCFLGRLFHFNPESLENYLKSFPLSLSGIIFVALYVVVTFFFWFSKDIFRFLGAIVFGAYYSTSFVLIAETANALILFSLARYLGRGFVEGALGAKEKNLDERLTKLNFFWLFLFRAVPLIPFRFLDLAAGITSISLKRYMLAVILGSPIRIFWLQYILAGVGRSIFSRPDALMQYLLLNKGVFIFSLIYIVLVIVVSLRLKLKG